MKKSKITRTRRPTLPPLPCPECTGHSWWCASANGNRVRQCEDCGYKFQTVMFGEEERFYKAHNTKLLPRERRAPQPVGEGDYSPPKPRKFKLAAHQRVIQYKFRGPLDPWHETGPEMESHLKLLRDNQGRVVVSDRGDLGPGEISVVLR